MTKTDQAHVDSPNDSMQQATASSGAPTAHTPAPWTARLAVDGSFVIAEGREGEGMVIARRHSGRPDSVANARLIAAAPDMLAALKKLTNEVSAVLTHADLELREAVGHTNVAVLQTRWTEAKAVIEKAEAR